MGKLPDPAELRAHPRISAPARAFVRLRGGAMEELPLRDISLGGVFVYGAPGLLAVGDRVEIDVALMNGTRRVALEATVVRAQGAPPEETGFGLRFEAVDERRDAALRGFVQRLLTGPGGNRRAYPRISHRVRVTCAGAKPVAAVLRDLSLGGAGLWLETPLALDERVTVTLLLEDGSALNLSGRVVVTKWGMDEHPFDQAGVEFVDVNDEQRGRLEAYLLRLVGLQEEIGVD